MGSRASSSSSVHSNSSKGVPCMCRFLHVETTTAHERYIVFTELHTMK
jgi:hypothetical protein